jgi:hypothetical protein
MVSDTRPRYPYLLPDGRTIRVIHDHGELPRQTVTYDLGGGQIVIAILTSMEPCK